MKDLILQPQAVESDVLVQFSEMVEINKHTLITVPNYYTAIVIDDEKVSFRIEPCVKKSFYQEYGKEMLGHNIKVAFILNKSFSEMQWGFGNIQVNNERLKEAYRVGANGKYQIEITDYVKLVGAFPLTGNITMDTVREKTISVLKSFGIPILSSCFSKTDVSVFEINALAGQIREDLLEALKQEKSFAKMGIKVVSLTLSGIHVNEDDLEIIRNRING